MKLQDLQENTDVLPSQQNLIVDVSKEGDRHIFIITDVQPISRQQFHKLVKLSFKAPALTPGSYDINCKGGCRLLRWGAADIGVDIEMLNHKGESALTNPEFAHYDDAKIAKIEWKEFITFMLDYYPGYEKDDDFSE